MDDQGPAKRAILITGPTASGKSALAISLAEHLGGIVVNMDAMQVYADLRILTARPGREETERVPHRLFGHVDAGSPYSVGRWLAEIRNVLDRAFASGQIPVLVGGTGLYAKALTQGLSAMPDIPEAIRTRVRAEGLVTSPEVLHAQLAACDPVMGQRLRPTDPQRILRALEVFEATGHSLAMYQARREPATLPMNEIAAVFVDLERQQLRSRIDRRFDDMIAAGALDEVAVLARRGLDPNGPALRALGVAPLMAALDGTISVREAITRAKTDTWHYAKRQITFARHQLQELTWVSPAAAGSTLRSLLGR